MAFNAWLAAAVTAVLMSLAACSDDSEPEPTATSVAGAAAATPTTQSDTANGATIPASQPTVQVVTTTAFVADWVENIGGERVETFSLVPVGGDPHSYQPGTRDVARIADADLVLSIGLGLEASWLEKLVHNASVDPSKIVELGDIVEPIEFVDIHEHHDDHEDEHDGEEHDEHDGEEHDEHDGEEHDEHDGEEHDEHDGEEHDEHDHGLYDPHFWFDPIRVKRVVNDISARLSVLDPEGGAMYRANASTYAGELDELHSWTEEQVGMVPSERRLLVTSHDSFSYFAQLYGFEVVGTVLPSLTTEAEPAAAHLAHLVEEVEERGVSAVFGETTVSERLAKAIADETGVQLVHLYSGSLGPQGSGAETYLKMVRLNVERIALALK